MKRTILLFTAFSFLCCASEPPKKKPPHKVVKPPPAPKVIAPKPKGECEQLFDMCEKFYPLARQGKLRAKKCSQRHFGICGEESLRTHRSRMESALDCANMECRIDILWLKLSCGIDGQRRGSKSTFAKDQAEYKAVLKAKSDEVKEYHGANCNPRIRAAIAKRMAH